MMNEKKKRPLLILTGPTAVGKTELSIALAKKINGAVISADSMQVYRGMARKDPHPGGFRVCRPHRPDAGSPGKACPHPSPHQPEKGGGQNQEK